jgi:hypothetical protein
MVVQKTLILDKSEFEGVEFNDFDFNKEMLDLLDLTDENLNEHFSPFANLFAKHVGNVCERYRVSESACEKLAEKFVELHNSTISHLEAVKKKHRSGKFKKLIYYH